MIVPNIRRIYSKYVVSETGGADAGGKGRIIHGDKADPGNGLSGYSFHVGNSELCNAANIIGRPGSAAARHDGHAQGPGPPAREHYKGRGQGGRYRAHKQVQTLRKVFHGQGVPLCIAQTHGQQGGGEAGRCFCGSHGADGGWRAVAADTTVRSKPLAFRGSRASEEQKEGL